LTLCSFSTLNDYPTAEAALVDILKISKSQLKKHLLPKNFLTKKIKMGTSLEVSLDISNTGMINPQYSGKELTIIDDNDFALVLNKPEGVHAHPLSYLDDNNALSFIRCTYHTPSILNVNMEAYDRGLLYRLDSVTSGVLIYIKSDRLHSQLRTSFKANVKHKVYLAIVGGKLSTQGQINLYYSSSLQKGKKVVASMSPTPESRYGEMSVTLCEYNTQKDVSLVKIHLQTGVRHQIRSGLQFIGNPILGDELYGATKHSRVYLHAWQYGIEIDGKNFSWTAEIPELFNDLFDLNSCL